MSDSEQTPPSLGDCSGKAVHSDILSVQHSPRDMIPDGINRLDEPLEVHASVCGERAWYIFPYEPPRTHRLKKSYIGHRETASLIIEASLLTCDREPLAGCSSNKKVNCSGILFSIYFRHVSNIRHVRKTLTQNLAGEWIYLREKHRLPSESLPCKACRLHTTADACVSHLLITFFYQHSKFMLCSSHLLHFIFRACRSCRSQSCTQ